jgi:hypothetical protein
METRDAYTSKKIGRAINASLGTEGICQVRKGILAEKHSLSPYLRNRGDAVILLT